MSKGVTIFYGLLAGGREGHCAEKEMEDRVIDIHSSPFRKWRLNNKRKNAGLPVKRLKEAEITTGCDFSNKLKKAFIVTAGLPAVKSCQKSARHLDT